MHTRNILVLACLAIFVGVFTFGCGDLNNTGHQQKSESGVNQVQEMFKIPLNSKGNSTEQQNIIDRLRVTTDPTKVMWIHLIALDGKIVKRMAVRNKITSSGKRLEPTQAASSSQYGFDYPRYKDYETNEIIQPDGTFGSSDPYVYWFDPMGRYHQWGTAGGLGYLLTDYPIDIENPMNEITGMYHASVAASKWQAEQEATLRAKEGK